jgi:hypothetical protein
LKSLTALWSVMANEFAIRCRTSATKDIETVLGRVKHEGISFLTISLPDFGKGFQKSLDQGLVDLKLFSGFAAQSGLPRFLGGFLDLVFDRGSGVVLDEPDIEAIIAIRQLTLLFSKVLLPCTPARERNAMSEYIKCEQEVRVADFNRFESDISDFHRVSRLLFGSVFSEIDKLIYDEDIVPKHGPGATADKLMGNQKFRLNTWTHRLQEVFSSENFLLPNARYAHPDDVTYLDPGSELPSRVVSVPKTMKTPRVIAIEPACMQYMQQAILEQLITRLESDRFLGQFLGFSDQGPNQDLARIGSESGSLATLDLSEASDRVSNQLIRVMLSDHPNLLRGVEAVRSRKADVPGHGVIRLAKFASMGSALCFPFEAMAFLVMVLIGIERASTTHFTKRSDVSDLLGRVRIYGDDIITPTDTVEDVILSLELFGARVGRHKSFWTGRFRESCGKEYYDGHDVSIVKFRRLLPTSRQDIQGCISAVSFANQLFKSGCWGTTKYVDSLIWKVLKHYPVVSDTSPVLGRTSFMGYIPERMCPHLHRPLVKGYVVRSIIPKNSLTGDRALLKFFLKRGGLPSADGKHLERSGRPQAVDIKLRWATPY